MLYNHFTEELLGLQGVKITMLKKKLLLKRFNKLESEQQQQVLVMSETSVNLSRSHWYKEKFLEILECNDRETAKEKMRERIYNASNCGIPQFETL